MKDEMIVEKFRKIFKDKKNIFYLAVILIFLAGISFRITPAHIKKKNNPFIYIDNLLSQWKSNKEVNEQTILSFFENYTNLLPFYQGRIIQELIEKNCEDQAASLAEKALQREGKAQDFFSVFSHISIHILRKEFKEALSQSYDLQKKIMQKKGLSFLPIYNLLRIALLERHFGHEKKAIKKFQELENLLNSQKQKFGDPLYNFFHAIIKNDKTSLKNFILYEKSRSLTPTAI